MLAVSVQFAGNPLGSISLHRSFKTASGRNQNPIFSGAIVEDHEGDQGTVDPFAAAEQG